MLFARVPLYVIVTCTYIPTQYYESLKLYYGSHSSSLELKLTGTGVDPSVELIPKGDMCDMGHVMATDTTTKTLQVRCLLINHATNVPFFPCQNVSFFLLSKCFFFSYQNVSFSPVKMLLFSYQNASFSSVKLKNRSPLSVRYHAQLESLLVSSLNNRNEHSFSKYQWWR